MLAKALEPFCWRCAARARLRKGCEESDDGRWGVWTAEGCDFRNCDASYFQGPTLSAAKQITRTRQACSVARVPNHDCERFAMLAIISAERSHD